MTSLELFPPVPNNTQEPPEWGTGKLHQKTYLWTPKPPTWHCTGQPGEQKYVLTDLKLSNVRMTDQLLPRPQDCEMGKLMIKKPFPAEHPYTSHISQFTVFPKFDSASDPKRGTDARRVLPKNAEMPSNAYDVTIKQKTKGFGFRHELQALPPESLKKPLEWNDGDKYDQDVKSNANAHVEYYPTTPKLYVPNLPAREDSSCIQGNLAISERTAHALRNVERDQWQTTYDRTHTGLGPANSNRLDNMHEKHDTNLRTGHDSDDIDPRSVRTFDPPRPFEGRVARALVGKPPPQANYPNTDPDPTYTRMQIASERAENLLWNGQNYCNYPDTTEQGSSQEDPQWRYVDRVAHPEVGVTILASSKGEGEQVPFVPAGDPSPGAVNTSHSEVEYRRREHHEDHQQIEAQNRFKDLDLQTPDHNLLDRKYKTDQVNIKTRPKVFYNHEGQYQRERAGLYKTTYDPYKLQGQMDSTYDKTGPSLIDHSDSHQDALNQMKDINAEMHDIIRYNRTLGGDPGSVPQLHSQPSQFEAIEPFNETKRGQTRRIQPNIMTSDVRTQENGITLQESTYGSHFNTHKFLQENQLDRHARQEPLMLMSHENQDLRNVRQMAAPKSGKSVQFSDHVTVATHQGGESLRTTSAMMSGSNTPVDTGFRPNSSPMFNNRPVLGDIPSVVSLRTRDAGFVGDDIRLPVKLEKSQSNHYYGLTNNLSSKPSNFMATNLRHSWAGESSNNKQFAPTASVDLSFKRDKRFDWQVGSGLPRPQTTLLDIQNSFTKTEARRRFHTVFNETNPDLRENILKGKKHLFGGLNAQTLRGTPVVG